MSLSHLEAIRFLFNQGPKSVRTKHIPGLTHISITQAKPRDEHSFDMVGDVTLVQLACKFENVFSKDETINMYFKPFILLAYNSIVF